MKKSVIIFAIFSAILFNFTIGASQIFAQGGGGTGGYTIPNPLQAESFEDLVKGIAKWFYYVMVPIASIMVLYAAFLFLTSGGDEEKIKKAKKAITYTIVGVAIIIIGAGFITLIKSLLETN